MNKCTHNTGEQIAGFGRLMLIRCSWDCKKIYATYDKGGKPSMDAIELNQTLAKFLIWLYQIYQVSTD